LIELHSVPSTRTGLCMISNWQSKASKGWLPRRRAAQTLLGLASSALSRVVKGQSGNPGGRPSACSGSASGPLFSGRMARGFHDILIWPTCWLACPGLPLPDRATKKGAGSPVNSAPKWFGAAIGPRNGSAADVGANESHRRINSRILPGAPGQQEVDLLQPATPVARANRGVPQ
jgi:hypothetical protein